MIVERDRCDVDLVFTDDGVAIGFLDYLFGATTIGASSLAESSWGTHGLDTIVESSTESLPCSPSLLGAHSATAGEVSTVASVTSNTMRVGNGNNLHNAVPYAVVERRAQCVYASLHGFRFSNRTPAIIVQNRVQMDTVNKVFGGFDLEQIIERIDLFYGLIQELKKR